MLPNFFLTENQRNTFKKALSKIQEMEKLHSEMMMEQMDKNIEQLKPKMKQMIEDNFKADTLEKSFMNTQGS
jgi:phage-related protein